MIQGINVLDLIIILGAIQGILFSLYLWFRPFNNRRASLFLSLFILGFALSSIYYTLETIGVRGFLNIWDFSPLYCPLLIVGSLYLFVRALLSPSSKINLLGWLLLGFAALQTCWQLWGTYWSLTDRDVLFNKQQFIFKVYNGFDLLLLILSIVVFVISIRSIFKFDKTLQNNYAEIGDFSLQWLNRLFFFLFGIWILFALPTGYELITGHTPFNVYYPMWIATSILIYWIGYSTYINAPAAQPAIYHIENSEPEKKLSDNTKSYHEKLILLMQDQQVYLDQDLNLKTLADKLGLSNGYLSQIINQYESKNFFEFVNGYRVEAVKEKITDPKYDHLNLLGIAYESGFKSKSTFNLVFKKLTGLTPSAYKKSIS